MTALDTNMTVSANAVSSGSSELRQAARELVGEVFYGTLLKQLRSSSLKGEYGHGGRGEEVFQSQLDEVLASHAGKAGDNKLTDALVARFERRADAISAYRRELRARNEEFAVESARSMPGIEEVDA